MSCDRCLASARPVWQVSPYWNIPVSRQAGVLRLHPDRFRCRHHYQGCIMIDSSTKTTAVNHCTSRMDTELLVQSTVYRRVLLFCKESTGFQSTCIIVIDIVSNVHNSLPFTYRLLCALIGSHPVSTSLNQSQPVSTSLNQSQPVSTSLNQSQPVSTSLNQSQPVSTSLNQSQPVSTSLNQSQPVSTSLNQSQPVSTSLNQSQPVSTSLNQSQPVSTSLNLILWFCFVSSIDFSMMIDNFIHNLI